MAFITPEITPEALGRIFFRFRLSTDEDAAAPTGLAMDGEVEDYKLELAKIGNLVWEDRNFDGIQGSAADEPAINDVEVILTFASVNGDLTYTTQTANVDGVDGLYYFCGLIPGTYTVMATAPDGLAPTLINRPGINEADDSDDPAGEEVVINDPINLYDREEGRADLPGMVNGFPDRQDELRIDFGFAAMDFGDLPEEFATLNEDFGPFHIINPMLHFGDCVDSDSDGQPEFLADGDDNNASPFTEGDCAEDGDDEDGIEFITPLIPGYDACVKIKTTVARGQAYINAFIDFNGDGDFINDPNDYVYFTKAGDQTLVTPISNLSLPQGTVEQIYCFKVPADATFEGGETHARFRISFQGNLGYDGIAMSGEVEDYYLPLAKVGNYVWEDTDLDGEQDVDEAGINDLQIRMTFKGEDGDIEYVTTTANLEGVDGQYKFCGLIPGDYDMEIVEIPEGMVLTIPNNADNGEDDIDSDGMPNYPFTINDVSGLPVAEAGTGDNDGGNDNFPDERMDETIDFGLIPEPEVKSSLAIKGVDYPDKR